VEKTIFEAEERRRANDRRFWEDGSDDFFAASLRAED